MRILFYEDPVTDYHTFMWRTPHVTLDATLYRALGPKWERRMLLNRHFTALALQNGMEPTDLIPVDEDAWTAPLDDPQENVNALFQRHFDGAKPLQPPEHPRQRLASDLCRHYSDLVAAALNGFKPDIIVAWVPTPFLRALFPDALILHRESGLFTRAPYPLTYYLDPCGLHQASWPARFAAQSRHPEALAAIEPLRAYYTDLFPAIDPYTDLAEQLAPFRKTILVATQVCGHFSFDAACAYRSPFHLALDVLNHAPADCAVLLGQHPNTAPLRDDEVAWLRERFPNFIHRPDFLGREGVSQHLLPYADALATVSSTLGWQSTFLGKPLIALGKSQLNRFAQAETSKSIPALLQAPPADTRAEAAWLVFHYCIPARLFEQPGWLDAYLSGRLEHWRQRGADGYYDQPYAAPNDTAAAIVAEANAKLESFIGPPLGQSGQDEAIDFNDSRRFGDGWSFCEHGGNASYRWIDGPKAILRLALTRSCSLSLRLATHAGCPDQAVTIGTGDTILATAKIPAAQQIEVTINVSRTHLTHPATLLWLKAAQASAPQGDTRNLSLICQNITVRPA